MLLFILKRYHIFHSDMYLYIFLPLILSHNHFHQNKYGLQSHHHHNPSVYNLHQHQYNNLLVLYILKIDIQKILISKGLGHIRGFFLGFFFFSKNPIFQEVGQIFHKNLFFSQGFFFLFFYNFFVKYPFTLQKLCFTILRNSK